MREVEGMRLREFEGVREVEGWERLRGCAFTKAHVCTCTRAQTRILQ